MFLDILQSGNTGSTIFSTKFFYSFWWGLRNLSNFGTNLETSSYIWENCFAILICVIGLLLFLFLIGNVQTYIQSESEKFVKIRDSRRMRINTKYRELEKWMSSHDVPDDMKTDTLKNISEYKVVERINKDAGARFMHRCYYKKDFKSDALNFICVKALKRIPILRKLDEQDLIGFCEHKFITTEDKDTLVTEAGQELFHMYLIIDGEIECNDAETMSTRTMHRYDCVGEEVLRWAILNYKKSEGQRARLPISTVDAKCLTDVEAFWIKAPDLLEILQKLNNLELASTSSADQRIEEWLLRNGFPEDLKANIMNCLDQNNLLVEENMHADVDVAFLFGILPRDMKPSMKRHLGMNALKKPVVYEKDSYIVRAGEPLSIMIFILRGKVIFTDTTSSNTTTTSTSEITENFDENVIEIRSYYGEQLLRWASPNNTSSSDNPVISTRNIKCQTKVEALILKAEDLRSAVSKCGSQWNLINNMNYQHLVGDVRDTLADTGDSTSTKIEETSIQLHQGHDMLLEQLVLIRETMFQFRDDMVRRLDDQRQRLDDQGGRLNEMAAFLARLGYTSTSPP
ncbi:hypothetical protein ACLB2K_023559 [Fragaria x ananassa]